MNKKEKFALCLVTICFGMGLVVVFDIALRWYEWTMIALGGGYNP